jgi:hypothetical protein
MANKKTAEKVTDAQFKAADEIYEVAKRQSAAEVERLKEEMVLVRQEASLEGYLAKVEYDISHNEFLRLMALYKMRQTKEYRKHGQTWEEFCDAHGYPRRTAEQLLNELRPIFEQFSGKLAGFFGISFNKIRLLGRSIAAESAGFKDGCLVYDDQIIPLDPEHKDEIEAVIDQIKEEAEKAKKDKALEVKAKDRVLQDKEKAIQKLHKNLEKLEGQAREKGLTPAEEGFLKKIDFLRTGFDGYMMQLDPDRMDDLSRDAEPTPRMRASYLAALDYMKKQILVAFDVATEMYGNAVMCPEAAWKPGMGAALESVESEKTAALKK